MYRDHTKVVKIGDRVIGGGNPILIQSMTNTRTEEVEATVSQIRRLTAAGFADEPESFAFFYIKRNIVYRLNVFFLFASASGRKVLLQVLYFYELFIVTHSLSLLPQILLFEAASNGCNVCRLKPFSAAFALSISSCILNISVQTDTLPAG